MGSIYLYVIVNGVLAPATPEPNSVDKDSFAAASPKASISRDSEVRKIPF
jgi:hypothetical protein